MPLRAGRHRRIAIVIPCCCASASWMLRCSAAGGSLKVPQAPAAAAALIHIVLKPASANAATASEQNRTLLWFGFTASMACPFQAVVASAMSSKDSWARRQSSL